MITMGNNDDYKNAPRLLCMKSERIVFKSATWYNKEIISCGAFLMKIQKPARQLRLHRLR